MTRSRPQVPSFPHIPLGPHHHEENTMTIHSTRRHLLGAFGIGGVALGAAACGSSDPFAEEDGTGGEGGRVVAAGIRSSFVA